VFAKSKFQKLTSILFVVAILLSSVQAPSALAQSQDGLKRQVNAGSGLVSFIGPENGRVLSASKALGTFFRPQDPAMALANRYAPEFGIKNPARELSEIKTSRPEDGRVIVRYQQKHEGIPVMGGELIVNTNENGDLYSMNGEVSPDLELPTQPQIDAEQAAETALQLLAKWYQKTPADFVASEPELWIYDESLLQASTQPVELVWRMEVTAKDAGVPVRELVLVNAQAGGISLHFNQIDNAWATPNKTVAKSTQPANAITTSPIAKPMLGESHATTEFAKSNMSALVGGNTWYVATTGNDANLCSSTSSPCLTINGAIGKATAEDTIKVASGIYTGSGVEVVLIDKSIMLSGGWDSTFATQNGASTIDGQRARRGILVNNSSVTVSLDRFIIKNGNSSINSSSYNGYGGGIYNMGNLSITRSSIQDNIALDGGGLSNNGTLNLNNTTISNNQASLIGGGIINSNDLTLNNTTISGNSAGGYTGGGIVNWGGSTSIANSILGGNTTANFGPDCYTPYGPIMSSGYNLIGNSSNCSFSSTMGDQVGTSTSPINPRLGPLQDNGGGTLTHALLAGSPAIDHGNPAIPGSSSNNACLVTDQRGIIRPVGLRCDIGAYEGVVTWAPAPLLVSTYTSGKTSALPGTFLCNQSQPNCTSNADPQADAAHKYALGTDNFYATNFLRYSINNNGMTIISTVHYCDPNFACPYANAYWSGSQMVYGDAYGYPLADDVVAHELTHGVTQYESNLFYYYQSGAINESLSDVFGEYYDQTNGLGNDTAAVKWLHGEDISGRGATRSMSNPPVYGDPDTMTSPNYYLGDGDSGGVHHNSGINNKAAYLMVDGGTFNGWTINALGWTKVGDIYYEANTFLLTSGADYSDLYYALQQACTNLIGQHGITVGDCSQVKNVLEAVEMYAQPIPNFNADAPLCGAGQSPKTFFSDDLESGISNWTLNTLYASRWGLNSSPYGAYAHSGINYLYAADYPEGGADTKAKLVSLTIPPNGYLVFHHAYDFEYYLPDPGPAYFDGGVLEYSTDSNADDWKWVDAGPLMDFNGYNHVIYPYWTNPLRGRNAFTGASHGYISTRLNLASLAGQSVTFRWWMGLDDTGYSGGWWVDDVQVYNCISNTISGNVGVAGVTLSYTEAGAPKSVLADASGNYTIKVPFGWTGTVTPKQIGYQFTPINKSYTNVQFNQIAQNYTASVCPTCADKDTVGVFRPSNGLLYLKNLNVTGFADVAINYGLGGDYPVVGDWNGDGTDTIGIYRNGTFYLRNSNTLGIADLTVAFGSAGDQPIAGDWNNDGTDTIGLYRSSTGTFLLRNTNTPGPADVTFALGNVGDVGIAGDWNGDGIDTTGVFRPSSGVIFLKNTNTPGFADIALNYGLPGDQPVVGDWDNNGTTTIGIYRNARFYLRNSNTNGFANILLDLGNVGDMPIGGNWDAKP